MFIFCLCLFFLTYTKAKTTLSQVDFDQGTYRIKTPGVYQLSENIVFRPPGTLNASRPELFLFPSNYNEYDVSKAYRLGFFAAITIETADVTLDLNGFTLEQSFEHALVQRFFSLIELASSPFPPSSGPASFADEIDVATNVLVKNGKLGLSSHHSIHGNGNVNITLENLEMTNFEVGGVSLNNVTDLTIKNAHVHDSRLDVPANGRLSQAIFALQTFSVHLDPLDASFDGGVLETKVSNAYNALRSSVYNYLFDHTIDDPLFNSNDNGIPDASLLMGVLIHPGVNVGEFQETFPAAFSANVVVDGLNVNNLKHAGREIAALVNKNTSNTNTDSVGAVFDVEHAIDPTTLAYIPNELADLQLAIAEYFFACQDQSCSTSQDPTKWSLLNRNKIDREVVNWASGLITFAQLLLTHDVVGNHDVMFHKNKGVLGLKLDGTDGISIKNVNLTNIENVATTAHTSALVEQWGIQREYSGWDTRGATLASCKNVLIEETLIDGLYAAVGVNNYLKVMGESTNIDLN